MGQYEVVRECYVPVGSGLRFKRPGNLVTLSDEDAGKLASYIQPAESDEHVKPKPKGVAKRNTKAAEPPVEPPVESPVEPPLFDVTGEVTPDAGDPGPGDE